PSTKSAAHTTSHTLSLHDALPIYVKPIAGTDSCQAAHMGYFISGRMKVVMDNGEEAGYGPGDFAVMDPGHDAWVVGDEEIPHVRDRKSTRLNSSHQIISYAVFCLK